MKIKQNSDLVVRVVVTAYVISLLVYYAISCYYPLPALTISVTPNLTPMSTKNDTASYREYDSMGRVTATYWANKGASMYNLGGMTVGLIGTSYGTYCDTCNIKWYAINGYKDLEHRRYYIKLPFWKINDNKGEEWYADSVKFHAEHGQGYVRRAILRKEGRERNGDYYQAYLADTPVKFFYYQRDSTILIPVSKIVKDVMDVVLFIIAMIGLAYFLYLIGAFLNFIFDLSKGLAFTDNNIWRLKLIAISLILYPIVSFAVNWLLRLVFYSYFTPDVVINWNVWSGWWKPIGMGLTFFLLYRAFSQGKALKDEQDLTV